MVFFSQEKTVRNLSRDLFCLSTGFGHLSDSLSLFLGNTKHRTSVLSFVMVKTIVVHDDYSDTPTKSAQIP